MILSAQTIREMGIVLPCEPRTRFNGVTFGLSSAGYDMRIDQHCFIKPGEFMLASSVETFTMPNNVVGIVHDKSSWARLGLAVQNTVLEPGWRGHLTIELSNHGWQSLSIVKGTGIAQVIFHFLDRHTNQPYEGKYQDQRRGVQPAILEK